MSNSDNSLFKKHEHALEDHGLCPLCDSALALKHGKKGSFLGCVSYPACEYTRPLVEHEKVEDQQLPGSSCPKCQSVLSVKQGRYGMFIGCSNYPECDHIENTQQPQEQLNVDCPQCNSGQLQEKSNRFGKTFYSCDNYPKCKYVLNHKPVQKKCLECDWSVMVERSMAAGDILLCPQKKCGHKMKK